MTIKQQVDSLDIFDKLKVYLHYRITTFALKYNFSTEVSFPTKYLWKDLEISSFEDFCSENNVVVHDNGENWEELRFAQRIRTEYFGIYSWFDKFKKEILK